MKRRNNPTTAELAFVVNHLAAEAAETGSDAWDDLHAIGNHLIDELKAFHRAHDVTRAAAPAPAWWTKRGDA